MFGLTASLFIVTSEAKEVQHPIKNIVLVHGAFADGSSWSEVIAALQRKGYHVTAVQNPLTSLADDVSATRRVLARQSGDVILVGHSYAGAVVTEAGNADNVKGIVYLSALVPDSGESVSDLLTRLKAPMDGLKPDNEGFIWLDDPAAYRDVMAGDVPEPRARILAATQVPISASAFAGKVSHAAWHDKPTWYLVTEEDHALKTPVQRTLAQQIGARVTTVKSSHMSLVSHPAVVANLIDRAAKDAQH
ncbi:alpha/beta fold hydrolase [Ralstonia chuxiongensis]|uniref:alpha/beta fold hydrolase n=1 Tax=Ralstonia chuxiongensis TaxID=2957504 RepID=UPI00292CF996|nr:alpha/beta hydrolase [Ralstonia chuxiongensis]